jgi:Region in Clathrin and VPS
MRLHAVTFLLHVNTATLLDTWQLWASVAHLDNESESSGGGMSSSLPSILHDPSPVLRYLCQMDAPAVLGVLGDGLKGWDALENDLIDLSPELGPLILSNSAAAGATAGNAGGRTITQAAVDAVVQLLDENKEPALLKFVAEHLASHRASAEDAVLLRVLRFLAESSGNDDENALSLTERESIFKDIVVHIHGNGSNSSSSSQHNLKSNPQVRGEALDLAHKAGFHQAEARIRHAERAFSQSFTCLVEDGNRYPLAPFQYLRDISFDPGLTESDRNLVKSTALKLAPQLVRIDPGETAAVVADCFSQESHVVVLEVLAPWPDDQFAFLQAAIEGSSKNGQNINGASGGGGGGMEGNNGVVNQRPGSGLSNSTARPMSPESTLESFRGDPLFAPLLNTKGVSSLYVRLLCRFQPSDVLPFLQAHDTYNVDECLKHCIDHGAREAAAFLLERKGDVQAALTMYLEQIDLVNIALVVAVKEQGIEGIPSYYTAISASSKTSPIAPQMRLGVAEAALPPRSSPAPSVPLLREFVSARDAMNSAVSMCVRFAQDRMTPIDSPVLVEEQLAEREQVGTSSSAGAASKSITGAIEENAFDFKADPVRAVWFEVLQRYVTIIRKLRAEDKENAPAPSTAPATSIAAPTFSTISDRLRCLERLFTAFMEEVISQMAGHVPLHSIAAAVLHKYSGDSFGDFRATLSSLLAACNFELAILRCASRVTGTDTIALLNQGYKQCVMPQVVVNEQESMNKLETNGNSGGGGASLGGASGSQRSMDAALRSLGSAQQIGQDAWAKAAAAAGPAASKLMEKAGFV